MAFAKINWKPSPKDLRTWGLVMPVALGLVGSLMYFVLEKQTFGQFLWGYGALAFVTGITGTVIAKPVYLLWMGFVFCISSIIGYGGMILCFYFVLFPIRILASLTGRDRLRIKKPAGDTYWEPVGHSSNKDNFERQF